MRQIGKQGWVTVLLCFFLLLVFAGCQKEEAAEAANDPLPVKPAELETELVTFGVFLGESDEELIAQRGEGTANYFDVGDTSVVSARIYEEEIFGLEGDAVFVFGDDAKVNEIILTIAGVSAKDLLTEIKSSLGEPTLLVDEDELFHAEWQKDAALYSLDDDGTTVAITIGRYYGGDD